MGLLVVFATCLWLAFVAGDDGVNGASLRTGLAVGVVIGAVPFALLLRPTHASALTLGGAMTAAGAVTMMGGNFVGAVLALLGSTITLVGASGHPPISWGLVGKLVGYGSLLAVALWLSLDVGLITLVAAVSLAAVVAISPVWDRREQVDGFRQSS